MMTKRSAWAWLVCIVGLALSLQASGQRTTPQKSAALRIYLARHGQTDWNLKGQTQGGIDIPLNDTGREQARQLKAHLAGIPFDAVYASALSRSRETAEIIHGSVPITTLPGLGERHFGKFEGRLTSDPEYRRRMWIPDDSLDGGESLNALRDRVRSALDTVRKQHPSGSILIVGHSYTNRMILSVLLGLTTEQMQSFDQSNDELYMIELDPGVSSRLWKLITEGNLKDL